MVDGQNSNYEKNKWNYNNIENSVCLLNCSSQPSWFAHPLPWYPDTLHGIQIINIIILFSNYSMLRTSHIHHWGQCKNWGDIWREWGYIWVEHALWTSSLKQLLSCFNGYVHINNFLLSHGYSYYYYRYQVFHLLHYCKLYILFLFVKFYNIFCLSTCTAIQMLFGMWHSSIYALLEGTLTAEWEILWCVMWFQLILD